MSGRPPPSVRRWARIDILALAVCAGCAGYVAYECVAVAAVRERAAAERETAHAREERLAAARTIAMREGQWRMDAKRKFPGDPWSQDDDFHNAEQAMARQVAAERRLTLSDVLRGIDELLRTDGSARRATASPCKPRPFYD